MVSKQGLHIIIGRAKGLHIVKPDQVRCPLRVADLVKELQSYGIDVDVVDPFASGKECFHEYGFGLTENIRNDYDAVIVAVSHEPYASLDENYFKSISAANGILIDVKGIYRHKIKELIYWSL